MQRDEIRSGVRHFIVHNILGDELPDTLTDSTLLLTTGIVSSLAMLEMVEFLEDTYEIALRQEDLDPDRLDSVELIVNLVEELRQVKGANRCQLPL